MAVPYAGESSGEDDVENTFDKDVLAQSIEELTLHSEIRAIEIQTGLDGLRRQMEMQELLVQQWQEEFRKEKKNLPAEFAAQLQAAQESVMVLRQKCQKLEEERPLPPPAATAPASHDAREELAVAKQHAPLREESSAAAPAVAKGTEKVPQKKGTPWMPPVQKSRVAPPRPPGHTPAESANLVELARRSAARAAGSSRQRSGSASRKSSGYPTSGADADTEGTPRSRR
mmetsp:Transcript_2501/g.5354  ORF Transcript_2501/g.5354 Transcript_2501/m.5354 type:complete len:229 (-) Transcript_2501:22-708(-)